MGNLKTVLFSVMDLNKYVAHKLEDSRFLILDSKF